MSKKKHLPPYPGPEQILEDPFYGLEPASSATEMTGMVAAAVEDEAEAEAYEEIWPMHRQKPVD